MFTCEHPQLWVSLFSSVGLSVDWKSDEVLELLERIETVLPNDEKSLKYSTMADKLDWEKVKFASYTGKECKEQWIHVTTKVRYV